MLAAPSQSSQPYRRGHSHKRSAAISGDFDLEFFKQPPVTQQSLNSPIQILSDPSTPRSNCSAFREPPSLIITEPEPTDYELNRTLPQAELGTLMTSTPSPKKHTRLNSWAHTLMKNRKDSNSTASSSSNETTPELKRQAVNVNSNTTASPTRSSSLQHYQIPEAIIDLDLASGIYRDPSTKSPTRKIHHRRTESAPELEDFLKYKIFNHNNNSSSQKPSRKNSAIFEEDEDEEDENYRETGSNASSTTNFQLNKNPSLNSLNSSNSATLLPPSRTTVTPTIQSTPNSMKSSNSRRVNASAARYQSYYNNLMLNNALKSSDSLSQITNGTSLLHKSSLSSFKNAPVPSSGSSTSVNSSVPNSPSRFKFESQIYDVLPSDKPQPLHQHRKSNSLVNVMNKLRPTKTRDSDSEYEGDSTLTPFNLGEPGPAINLAKLKELNDYNEIKSTNTNELQNNEHNELKKQNEKGKKDNDKKKLEETQKKRRFFSWRKK